MSIKAASRGRREPGSRRCASFKFYRFRWPPPPSPTNLTVNGGFENTIRATDITCKSARKLVRRWHNKSVTQGQGGGTKYVGSYYCKSRNTDPEHVKVTCTYGTHRVTFFAGP